MTKYKASTKPLMIRSTGKFVSVPTGKYRHAVFLREPRPEIGG